MNNRPSTSILSVEKLTSVGSARSLRRRLVSFVGAGALIVLAAVGYAGLLVIRSSIAGDSDDRLVSAANLSTQLVERVLAERTRQVELIASSPSAISAARKGSEEARKAGLPMRTFSPNEPALDAIEARYKATRSFQDDPAALQYLTSILPKLDIAEIMVTDEHGYNGVTTSPSSDFIQSDEAWWQSAWNTGASSANATADPATKRTVVEMAGVIRDQHDRVGVTKVKFGLSLVDSVLALGGIARSSLRVDLVDSAGRVIASSRPGDRFKPFAGYALIATHDSGSAFRFQGDSARRGAVAVTNGGRWRVVAHMSEAEAGRAYNVARTSLFVGLLVMAALIFASLVFVSRYIERRITGPAAELARAAEAVAEGDLSTRVEQSNSDDEIGRLAQAVSAMIAELRRLATALNESTSETTSMTAEITASSEEMAASAGQIAHTAADLSQQANLMAETIQALAGSSENLVRMATDLDTGATEGVERNARLRTLALENRARLDESSRSLALLNTDAEASAAAIEQLAQASEEIRTFVTLVQKLARQSKLLALNAAMEAARAGEHGHGFAVVAEEVRRLSAMSSDAAERTERVVTGVLQGIAQSRTSTERTVETVRAVRGATEGGSRSFGDIEAAVAAADGWTASIRNAVTSANGLAHNMRAKLDSLASGTESFAAAMEEVAASSEEQSASTEQIAAAAGTLSGAADRLTRVVANLRLDGGASNAPGATGTSGARPSGPVKVPANVGIGRPTPARSSLKV
jgi:methyl-accepting chemotaxis protein